MDDEVDVVDDEVDGEDDEVYDVDDKVDDVDDSSPPFSQSVSTARICAHVMGYIFLKVINLLLHTR